ncbi:MAG: pentapeptide repeat-containing protein [Bacteroidales bacterium]|nr:pentapeptide repeat-containing protein [Bacteroidales bacterium]
MKFLNIVFITVTAFLLSCSSNSDKANTITAQKIMKKISDGKNLIIKDKTVKGFLDFTKAQKVDNKLPLSTVYIDNELIFINCTFEDSVTAFFSAGNMVKTVFEKNVTFYDCKFIKGADFTQADFSKDFNFELSNVKGRASFDGVDFSKGAVFASANFQDDCSFINCRFSGRTTFYKSVFKKTVIWQKSVFYAPVSFWDARFYGYFEFSDIKAYEKPDFMNAKFSDRAVFCNSLYNCGLKIDSTQFEHKEKLEQNGNKIMQSNVLNDIFNQ